MKVRAISIIDAYIKHYGVRRISYHTLEKVRKYGLKRFNKQHNTGTYDREFRTLKSLEPTRFTKVADSKSYMTWKVNR